MNILIKGLRVEKMDDKGHGLARLATLSAIDHDGDTYADGAFGWKEGNQQWVPILPAHNRGAMPFGKARVYEEGGVAYAELHLNLDTEAGREWHAHLKFDLTTGRPAQEWSYGFGVLDAADEVRGQDRVRVLKRVDVHEVSPVVRGAGMGTGTLAMKSRGAFGAQIDALLEEIDDVITRAGEVGALREAQGREMSKARLEQLATLKGRLEDLLAKAAPPKCAKCGSTDLDEKGTCKSCGSGAEENALVEQTMAEILTRGARRRVGMA